MNASDEPGSVHYGPGSLSRWSYGVRHYPFFMIVKNPHLPIVAHVPHREWPGRHRPLVLANILQMHLRVTVTPFIGATHVGENVGITTNVTSVTAITGHPCAFQLESATRIDRSTTLPKRVKSLPTPIDVDKLHAYLHGYDPTRSNFLLSIFRHGFIIPFDGLIPVDTPSNLASCRELPHIVQEKLHKELQLGRIAGPFVEKPFAVFAISPIGLVPKKTPGKYRLIHHLSHPLGQSINSGIRKEFTSVAYHSVDHAIDIITSHRSPMWLAKTDIESAFRLMPVHPDSYHLLGFQWNHHYYYDKTLAMGLSASCQVFEKFSCAIQWVAQSHLSISHMLHILDDFLIIETSHGQCKEHLNNFIHLCSEVGIPLAAEKTEGPSTTLTFAGIELDTINAEARLPLEKLHKYRILVDEVKYKKKLTLRELQSIIGCLNHCCYIIPMGRPFLRRLIDLTIGILLPQHKIRLNKGARQDLSVWSEFLHHFNGKSMFLEKRWFEATDFDLFTDSAQTLGYGALCGKDWFYGEWPKAWKDLNITLLELYPIVIAIQLWGATFANKRIILHTDNMALTYIINKLSSPDKKIMALIRRFTLLALQHNILFRSVHIAGRENVLADALSRLHLQVFRDQAPHMNKYPSNVPIDMLPENCSLD